MTMIITYSYASNVDANIVQYRDHVRSFGNAAFQTGIKGIATEDSDQLRLIYESWIVSVLIAKGLKSSNTTTWVSRAWFHMVDVIEM